VRRVGDSALEGGIPSRPIVILFMALFPHIPRDRTSEKDVLGCLLFSFFVIRCRDFGICSISLLLDPGAVEPLPLHLSLVRPAPTGLPQALVHHSVEPRGFPLPK